jgi:hypothetical protein
MYNIIDSPAISELAFWPRPLPIPHPFTVSCGDAELACYYHEYDPNGCTVVFFHGNGEVVAEYSDVLPQVFEIIGCNTFIAEYRGYGGSTGESSLSHLFSDCRHILPRIPTPPERMIFFGRSLGCLQAVEAASLAPTARGLVLESGLADLYDYILWVLSERYGEPGLSTGFPFDPQQLEGLRREALTHYDIRTKLSGFTGYALVTCALFDSVRRRENADRLFSWLRDPKRLIKFPYCNHNNILLFNIKQYCEQILKMANGTFCSV